jgi:hypothetical protein
VADLVGVVRQRLLVGRHAHGAEPAEHERREAAVERDTRRLQHHRSAHAVEQHAAARLRVEGEQVSFELDAEEAQRIEPGAQADVRTGALEWLLHRVLVVVELVIVGREEPAEEETELDAHVDGRQILARGRDLGLLLRGDARSETEQERRARGSRPARPHELLLVQEVMIEQPSRARNRGTCASTCSALQVGRTTTKIAA